MRDTAAEMTDNGHSARGVSKLENLADGASTARKELNDAATRIREAGGEAYFTENGYHIPEGFRVDNVIMNNGTAPRGWVDGVAPDPNDGEMVATEYKGAGARVNGTPRVTTYEGKVPQTSPAYTRDRILSDPRFAQHFHDHPDVWQSVQNGDIKITTEVIAIREPGRIEVINTPSKSIPEVTQHLQNSIDKFQKAQESTMNPATSNGAGSTTSDFRYYPADQAVGIIRVIAEHRWPMTVEEAFSLRDQFDWTPAPDDGRSFVTPTSNGEEDGHVSLVVNDNKYISGISFRLTNFAPPDPGPEIRALIQSTHSEYVAELTSLYGTVTLDSNSKVEALSWYLSSHASIGLGVGTGFVSTTIESSAAADLIETGEKYSVEGGELQSPRTAASAP